MPALFAYTRRPKALGGLAFTLTFAGFAAAVATGGACTSSNDDVTNDAGGGGGGGDSSSPETDGASPGSDGSNVTPDASPDAADAAAACPNHLPAGFTQVVVSPGVDAILTGAGGMRAEQMTLDENDDPMFAYASEDSASAWSIHFTRWDACAGAFTAPLTVDSIHSGADPDVSIAYDPTTKEVGIAYVKSETDNNWADSWSEIWLGTMKFPATAFTVQELTIGSIDDNSAAAPSIVMHAGHIYLGFWEGPYRGQYAGLVWLASSTATPGYPTTNGPTPIFDGGTGDASVGLSDDAGPDAGPAPPHYFSYEAMPYDGPGSYEGYANPLGTSASVVVAVDSNGAPAVAAYQVSAAYGKEILYWRPGTASANLVYSFAVDNGVDLAFAFDGTKPRLAGHMLAPTEADASTTPPDTLMFFASDDGVSWSPGVNLPNNDGSQSTAFTSSLALDQNGHAAIASDINTSAGNGMACGANPYIATSSDEDDGGAVWVACGADTASVHAYNAYSITALYGASRVNGTLVVSFVSEASKVIDAGADQVGIIYWQHP